MQPLGSLLVPEGSRLIHIGPHKTGSTAIQVAMHEARFGLAEHGVHYAGAGTRPRKAGWALGLPGQPAETEPPDIRYWEELVEEVAAAAGKRVCVSNEDFGRADDAQAARVVHDLGGGRPHVVAVARRLDRYLPSQWQERVKAGAPRSYETWLGIVLDESPDELSDPDEEWERRNVWSAHDIEALVGRWAALVGPESFTLLVADDTDRVLLPRAFEALLGLPEGLLRVRSDRSNRSLSWGELELVLALNQAGRARGWTRRQHQEMVKETVVRTLKETPVPDLVRRTPPMPAWARTRVQEISDARAEAVERMDVRVVGDPGALRVPPVVDAPQQDAPPTVTVARAAAAMESIIVAALAPKAPARAARPRPGRPPATRSARLRRLRRKVVRRLRRVLR